MQIKLINGLLFDLVSDHSCCQPSTTVVSPPVLSAVVGLHGVRRSEPVVHNRRPLRRRRRSRAGGGPASFRRTNYDIIVCFDSKGNNILSNRKRQALAQYRNSDSRTYPILAAQLLIARLSDLQSALRNAHKNWAHQHTDQTDDR